MKIQNAINDFAAGTNFPSPEGEGGRHRRTDEADMAGGPNPGHMPELTEVEKFFVDSQYPSGEAKKFFNHYKAIGWKIQGKTPIEDWKALAEKWMENAKKWDDKKQSPLASDPVRDIQFLFEQFIEGKKIFKYILPEHFSQLKLELTEETILQASQERIEQLTGTNQNSIIKLWEAYLTGDQNHDLVLKDKPNLIALAKRIAVIKHFQSLRQSGNTSCKQ